MPYHPTPVILSDAQRRLRSETENLFALIRHEAWTVASEHAEYIANELKNLARKRQLIEEVQSEISLPSEVVETPMFQL